MYPISQVLALSLLGNFLFVSTSPRYTIGCSTPYTAPTTPASTSLFFLHPLHPSHPPSFAAVWVAAISVAALPAMVSAAASSHASLDVLNRILYGILRGILPSTASRTQRILCSARNCISETVVCSVCISTRQTLLYSTPVSCSQDSNLVVELHCICVGLAQVLLATLPYRCKLLIGLVANFHAGIPTLCPLYPKLPHPSLLYQTVSSYSLHPHPQSFLITRTTASTGALRIPPTTHSDNCNRLHIATVPPVYCRSLATTPPSQHCNPFPSTPPLLVLVSQETIVAHSYLRTHSHCSIVPTTANYFLDTSSAVGTTCTALFPLCSRVRGRLAPLLFLHRMSPPATSTRSPRRHSDPSVLQGNPTSFAAHSLSLCSQCTLEIRTCIDHLYPTVDVSASILSTVAPTMILVCTRGCMYLSAISPSSHKPARLLLAVLVVVSGGS
uniref:Uncharacterized protein n=1 Tax=Lygus hesperus TaxID=30085 RepID=A0A146KM42_LYGHE